jgi:glycosyltransferase involved in cell wall biosynthesis
MRILLLSHLFPKASDRRHGIFVQRQAERLRELGHEVVVVVPVPYLPAWLSWVPRWRRYKRQRDPHDAGGFEIHLATFLRPPGAWFQPYQRLTIYYGTRATIRRLHVAKAFDVLYAQDLSSDVQAGTRIAHDLGIACVGMAIGGDLNQCANGSRAYRREIARSLEACDAVVCNSEALAEKVSELTQGRQSAVAITRGVDVQRFCPVGSPARLALRRRLHLPENGLLIIYAGYLERNKGVFELVEAFHRIAKSHPDAHLILVGEGSDHQELVRLAAGREAEERMHFLGHVDHDRMPSLFQACDIAAMTSWAEGMPNAVVEAIACGLPTVATRVGGIPQAVRHECSGLLVPPQDIEAIAEALGRLLRDLSQRERFGREARRIGVTEFDARENSRRLAALLEGTLRGYRDRCSRQQCGEGSGTTPAPSARSGGIPATSNSGIASTTTIGSYAPVTTGRDKNAPHGSLAMIVDITGTAPQYDAPLSKALADYPEVVFRASPFFPDPSAYANNALRRDLLGTAAWLADRWPAVVRQRLLWKMVQLHGYLSGWLDVLREIRRKRTPVLHIQWSKLPFLDIWLMRRAQRRGVRIVYTIHNALPHNVRTESARRAYRKLYRQADALVVLSGFVRQQVLAWVDNSVADKIHVIEHGVLELPCPTPNREESRLELNLGPDAEVALFMGGIRAYKGITDLIDAIDIARRDRPKLRLIIAGMPQEPFDPYQDQIQRLALTGIVHAYPRYVSEQFKAALYAAADVAVLPHRDASQSAMGLEALGAGKPIIVTRGGGLVELVDDDVNGYSVPIRDPATMAQALIRFFNLPRSRQEAMAAASRALGRERFAWSLIARKHVDLYRRLAMEESLAHRA